ncbi:MAG: MopE-related protein [Myxococcota bacterium]
MQKVLLVVTLGLLVLGCEDSRRTTPRRGDAAVPDATIVPDGNVPDGGGCNGPADCNDGISCTVDTCVSGACMNRPDNGLCMPGQSCGATGCMGGGACTGPADCADMDPCTTNERCEAGACTFDPVDADMDGAGSAVCGGTDCDDSNAMVGPGQTEVCDGLDNDCDLMVDGPAANGSCGVGQTCTGGMCQCSAGRMSCGGTCVDTNTSSMHCGGCDRPCLGTGMCNGGVCQCPAGQTYCPTAATCVDTTSDPNHCGGCAMPCGGTLTCRDSACRPACNTGGACTATCPAGGQCIPEDLAGIGGAADPITNLPGGSTMVIPSPFFPGGYCTEALVSNPGDPGACDPDAPAGTQGCGTCASCFQTGGVVLCAEDCTRSLTTRGGCRTGYQCLLGNGVCWDGCDSTDECRVQRRDTNGDGLIDAMTDNLVYDTLSSATCNMATGRCDDPGTATAVHGGPCTRNAECPANSFCALDGFPGGVCTKSGCDVPGNACVGVNSTCFGGAGGSCLTGCVVGAEPTADRLGVTGRGAGCRTGYQCDWDGTTLTGTTGACLPGNYNAVTIENVGAACPGGDTSCYSPYGQGLCVSTWGTQGSCTILDCDAPGIPAGVCGTGNSCTDIGGVSVCMQTCTTATECAPGLGCVDHDALAGTARLCWPVCTGNLDCRVGETCDLVSGLCG